jgi:hypothetical protein
MRQLATLCAVAACIGIASPSAYAQDVGVGIYIGPPYTVGPSYEPDYYYGPQYTYGPQYYEGTRFYRYSRRIGGAPSVEPELGTNDYWADRDSNRN